jgi:hypothetical protein
MYTYIFENYGFFIFLLVLILIMFYFQNGQCPANKININNLKNETQEKFTNQTNGENINIANVNYLESCNRMKDYYELQKAKKRYEIPFNCYNYGYVTNQLNTPLVPLQSYPTFNFHPSYGPEKEMCC